MCILWKNLYQAGHEAARLSDQAGGWLLDGTAVLAHEHKPCCLQYRIECDAAWQTRSAVVTGWVGAAAVQIEIQVDGEKRWFMNGEEAQEVSGCIDLDLNFSPLTNTLPIRRLGLAVGQAAEVQAAWLRFPSFVLQPLDQRYLRLRDGVYRYESGGGTFRRDVEVSPAGLVTHYPDFWLAEVFAPDC
jgi:hypothetical protein